MVMSGSPSAVPAERALSGSKVAMLLDCVMAGGHELSLEAVLRRVVECAVDLIGARYGALGILNPSGDGLQDFLHVGLSEAEAAAIGALPSGRGILGHLIHDPAPLRVSDLAADERACGVPAHHPPMTSFLGVPIRVRGDVFGDLYVTDKTDGTDFTPADEALATSLAAVAGVSVENFRLHARVSEMAALEERERIARDLHDTVIQRIFSIGLTLDGIGGRIEEPFAGDLKRAAQELNETVDQIRTTVFSPPAPEGPSYRPVEQELAEYLAEMAEPLGIETSVRFTGSIDDLVSADRLAPVVADLFAAARDAIRALHEHHQAEQAVLAVTVGAELTLTVTSDALGSSAAPPSWLDELEARARAVGGQVTAASDEAGTEIRWSVPLAAA